MDLFNDFAIREYFYQGVARHHIRIVKSFVIFYGHKYLIAFGSFTHNYKKTCGPSRIDFAFKTNALQVFYHSERSLCFFLSGKESTP